MTKTTTSPEVIAANPCDADEMVKCWTLPDPPKGRTPEQQQELDEKYSPSNLLFEGADKIPSAHRRQSRLIGQVIDAGVVLDLYEKLPKAGFNNIRFHFLGEEADIKQEFDRLKALPRDKQLSELVEVLNAKPAAKVHLRSHRHLVDAAKWQSYERKFDRYLTDLEVYHQVKDFSGGEATPDNKRPEMPVDPRIALINEDIANTIQIFSSGAKEQSSVERKMREKKLRPEEMKDIVRLCVLPELPQYGDDFIAIMTKLNPPKLVDNKTRSVPRVFAQLPMVTRNGYYQQQMVVAQDGDTQDPPRPLPGNTGLLAEIKIVPPKMWDAQQLTAITRDLAIRTKNLPPANERHAVASRIALMQWYGREKTRFEEKKEKFGLDYTLPPFPADARGQDQAFKPGK